MLTFNDLSVRRGARLLFEHATFTLFRGERIGITGANGCGKSTLLALVRGEVQPDLGNFEMPNNLAVAHVSQELIASDQPAVEFVMDGDAELRAVERAIAKAEETHDGFKLGELHARYDGISGYDARSRAARLLHGLGFSTEEESRAVREFSGGWRVRLNVAQALMCRSTNHLDLDAVIWLAAWLKEYRGTLLLISHDREFLDDITNRIVHIEHETAKAYSGNYSAFEEQRAAQLAQHQSMFERQQREIAHMMSFVERFRAQATKARQAQSRLKALERMQRIAPAHVDSNFAFSFDQPEKLPRPLLAMEQQSAGYGDRVVVSSISMAIAPGDRIALLGRNGAGKSTVTKLLAGELQSKTGRRTDARDLRIGYFAQHQLEQLNTHESPLEHLRRLGGERAARLTETDLRGYLGSFGFTGERVFEAIGPFSGGEKARLVLALVSFLRPNLLLLDEPTNHLDLEMRQALAVALQDYTGAVIMVSHDRHMLRTVADQFFIVANGICQPFDGDLEDYARWLDQNEQAAKSPGKNDDAASANQNTESAEARKQRKREEAERRNRLAPLRAELAKVEQKMDRLRKENALIEQALSDESIYQVAAKAKLTEWLSKQTLAKKEMEQVETRWLELAEELEQASLAP
jgi:ATP-binding cassette, subfamily F, member 3